ncbi:hypothetical protein [Streptomyces indicus]|uniref:DUF3558 domain-containing protein n=1 Tax=Streptomyces indicus TaxID=417292 RepID=A0A1G8VV27_9ACTN|nr:hypothetical protein [Streptomyces indicus]SDJ69080.1 hypothetical protein SAMN05421806_10215 [Streptomyces indicus]
MNKKYIAGGVVGALLLTVGIGYAAGWPPFERRGIISADNVCKHLGPGNEAAAALNSILPASEKYSLMDGPTNPRTDYGSYASSCFVEGDGDLLLSVRAELMMHESQKSWFQSVRDHDFPDDSTTPFAAGDGGFQSPLAAAIFVPCVADGKIPGGQHNLSVKVRLTTAMKGSSAEDEANLRRLAIAASNYAHKQARCDLPAKLDGSLE